VRRAFYELLWHLGGSQTDIARLAAENIDWPRQTISYRRHKTGTLALQAIGPEVAAVLQALPQTGYLFPTLANLTPSYRGHAFVYRLQKLGITGLTLHSYRYAWAERAMAAGYPERFAMRALGHASEAVHRAYAKQAQVILPPLETYEVVGKWVWLDVSPARKPMLAKVLWSLGFHWNQRRGVWQHPCGRFDPLGSHPTDPRRKYRSYFPADVLPA